MDIHNKIVYLLRHRYKYNEMRQYRAAVEDITSVTTQKLDAAKEAGWTVINNQDDKYNNNPNSTGKEKHSLGPKYSRKAILRFARKLHRHVLFDFGFRIFTEYDYNSTTNVCICPLSRFNKTWTTMYQLHDEHKQSFHCQCSKMMKPSELMNHLRQRKGNCIYHEIVYEYLFNLYSNWWEPEAVGKFS